VAHASPSCTVGDEKTVNVNTFSPAVTAFEGREMTHPDPKHRGPIASSISFATPAGDRVEFRASDRLLTSANLLDRASPVARAVERVAGMKPWYTRFRSQVSLTLGGSPAGEGEAPSSASNSNRPGRAAAPRGVRFLAARATVLY
jgi:hypothetical protein